MEKKLLLAIDGSKNSLLALDYVTHLFQCSPGIRISLFHVLPPIPPIYKEDALMDRVTQKYLNNWKIKQQEAIETILHRSRERLIKTGWPEDQVEIRAQEKRVGVARDILFEAQKGLYDAVVVGRRGLSAVQQMFLGSVSIKIIQGAKTIPVWVIGGRVTNHKILMALDGSENATRAVDHLAFILESCRQEDIQVLLLHVWPGYITVSGPRLVPHLPDRKKYEENTAIFFKQAEEMILESGLPVKQVEKKIYLKGIDIGKAILSEAHKGGYGTLVLGRRGLSRAKEFLMGSISTKILQQAADKAVWIIG
jgi:nucleotide-binding universal stress UspA family protein